MHEHEAVPAVAPAPALAAPAAAAAPTGPAQVLALQRSAGNAATTRLLQRSPTAAPGTLAASDLQGKIDLPSPRTGAGITARVDAHATGDMVIVESDFVDLKGEATAKETDPANPEAPIDPEVRVGFIQTLEQVGRIGQYTDDGTASGKPYADVRPYVKPGTRDVQGQKASAGAAATQKGTPPFYDFYKVLTKRGQTQDLTSADRLKAGFEVEIDGGKGKLASIGGTDRFRTSVAAHQPPAAPVHLDAAEWSQDWSIKLDPKTHTGTGAVPTAQAFKGALASLGTPEGAANWDAQMWKAVKDPAALAALSHGEMLTALPMARAQDRPVYDAMAKRLRDENPKLRYKLDCVDDGDLTGDADITFSVEGVRGAKTRTATVGSGPFAESKAEFAFGILDFFDPDDVTTGMTLAVTVTKKGGAGGTLTARHPWAHTHAIQVQSGGGKFNVTIVAI